MKLRNIFIYIKKIIEVRVKAKGSTEEARMKAVRAFVGSGNKKSHPYWNTDKKIRDWQREMREDPPRLS
ncbi:hypothetical protein CO058_00025 [candidate division WWE3 bacterium CG_4_9_14_0_2_um_filter_35_11]|uniref:Uncharacterized protein n=1 Tax=candidate division WWE3 bacterium CG_4_9_14_0_2_um_filter_35_11 TaxID=1975077 RepID=A0A2M8EMV4_UNCKA|nr:MAG: hypothetical protein COV25_00025 [candidate division WWE3 bacterium CG10_big_fil_rev_8_21_14_0_10_35_32]PJC24073.1 MAG: hypothetical protein CO058_00025 [candidate division WWE3 bacterium CG_4_9_14_0_2_um_filter_35_11]